MELKLLYHGERVGECVIDMPDLAESRSRYPFALLWLLSVEQVPSVAFGFLADINGTVELSQPIVLDLSPLGEQYRQFASDRPSLRGRLRVNLDSPNAHGYIRGYLDGWGIEGHIHADLHGRDFHGYMHGDFDGDFRLRGSLRAEVDGQGVQGYVRMRGEFFGREFGEFRLEISQSGLRVDAFGDGPFFHARLSLDSTEGEDAIGHNLLGLLMSIIRYELERRATDSVNVSLQSLVLPIDSPIFSKLLDISPDSRRDEREISYFFELARSRSLERLMALAAPLRPPIYTLVRYPFLETPPQVFVGKSFLLTIGLGKSPVKGTSGLVVLENLPPSQDSFPVEFEVLSADFAFIGDNNKGILNVRHDEQSVYTQLELIPLPIEGEYHLADLIVVFHFAGKRCGTAHRTLLILANDAVPALKSLPETEEVPEKASPVEFVFGTKTPDLTFELFKSSDDATSFDCYVRSPHLIDFPRRFLRSRLDLGLTPATYMSNLYRRIVQQQSDVSVSNCVAAIGDILYDIAPDCFKKAYWKLHDELGDKFQTIQIYSDEPWIPWELMRPMRQKEDGTIEEHSFLGTEHSVGRWLNMRAGEPPQNIQVTKVVAIAPRYRPPLQLQCAELEAKWLAQQIGAIELTPATKDKVLDFLKTGEAHIIHFSCHGKSSEDANLGELLLEDGSLSAFELESREIRFGLPAKCHPLVFINACESGRTGLTLGGVGGLASAFVDISCSAIIGTLWSVDDKDAFDVVQMFYSFLLGTREPLSIADIMRAIRKEFSKQKRDTFLAYTFFGDPHATVILQQIPTRARRGS